MTRDNLSVVIHKKDDLRVEQTPLPPEPNPDEVQLATHTVGICGSDIHFWKDGGIDKWIIETPMISGHETSATVYKVGSKVKNVKVGDRVAVEPGIGCMNCQVCKDGRYNLCEDVTFHACPPTDGSLRRYFNHKASFCHVLPENISYGEGALMEPLSVAVYACQRANIKIGTRQKILVAGAGPVGLLSALTAKALGAERVCITDINNDRLNTAKTLGLETFLINPKEDVESSVEKVRNIFGESPHITIECTGAESSITMAIYVTKDGGTVVMVGLSHGKVCVPLTSAACREVNLLGIKRQLNTFPLAIQLVSNGLVNIKPLITHRYKIERAADAFEHTRTQSDGAIKVQIECHQ